MTSKTGDFELDEINEGPGISRNLTPMYKVANLKNFSPLYEYVTHDRSQRLRRSI